MLGNMGGKLKSLKDFTIFNVNDIIAGKSIVLTVLILVAVEVVFYWMEIYLFSKRNLSV